MPTLRLVLVVGLLLGAACGAEAPPANGGSAGTETAPDFTVETFADGTFALGEQRGKVVVLNFFESW
ncbi:MAG: peroxiredoxin family protein [Actinomycetota bacterium]